MVSDLPKSPAGKVTSLFSALDALHNAFEWLAVGGAKVAGVWSLDTAESLAAPVNYSLTQGTATGAASLEGSAVLGATGTAAVAAGTYVDLSARAACTMEAFPETATSPAWGQ